ncbi:hypothetical protein [Phormidesmis priestleyi]
MSNAEELDNVLISAFYSQELDISIGFCDSRTCLKYAGVAQW